MTTMKRCLHHEAAMNAIGWCITIAPIACVAAEVAVRKIRRKKGARK